MGNCKTLLMLEKSVWLDAVLDSSRTLSRADDVLMGCGLLPVLFGVS